MPNRALILDRLGTALARGRRLGSDVLVYFLDLDDFKVVNDTLGHTTGDMLLVEVSRRLQGELRAGDTVGRLGGDEFVVLCEDVHTVEESDLIAERLRDSVCRPIDVSGYEVLLSASLGLAKARQGDTAETLLRDADTAMYLAKERGRNQIQTYDEGLRQRSMRRAEAERALVDALEGDGLRVLYQPIVRSTDHTVVGAEALVRCVDEAKGLVPPSEFIPVAEAMGLVNQIDLWMLDRVCEQVAAWSTLRQGRPFILSSNISTRLLALGDLAGHVERACQKYGAEPAWIRLELTETTLIHGGPQMRKTLQELSESGVRIGIDDFGTGYSSLTHPPRLPRLVREAGPSLRSSPGKSARQRGHRRGGLPHGARARHVGQRRRGRERWPGRSSCRAGCPASAGVPVRATAGGGRNRDAGLRPTPPVRRGSLVSKRSCWAYASSSSGMGR